jgi:hypothetical protein
MAPEQAQGKHKTITPATDVYALGAILYECLTGRPPFRGVTALATIEQVRTEGPLRPRKLQRNTPRDLETICLKCLEKEPGRRYASAEALAEDLRRFLENRPIEARPAGLAERVWRWCRRNPLPASLLVTITLAAGFGMWSLSRLSESVVRYSALEGAAQQAEMFDEVNNFYSDRVVDHARAGGVVVTHLYAGQRGTIPVPATFTIELGQQISAHSQHGVQVRLYSDAPFRSRRAGTLPAVAASTIGFLGSPLAEGPLLAAAALYPGKVKDGGPRDEFEREALRHLKQKPEKPYYRFEDFQGRPVLRYATARRMHATCIKCHNEHLDSPRNDWEIGDVRGVLEIIRPLDKDVARTQEGLRGSFLLVAGLSGGMLLLCGLILVLRNRRRPFAGLGD